MTRWKVIFIATLFISKVFANTPLDAEQVIAEAVKEAVKKECGTCRVEVRILNKKIIDDILVPDRVIADHWKGQTNLVLELGDKTRIVTADIRWMDDVVIAKDNLKIGNIVAASDVEVVERDVTYMQIPYARKLEQVLGFVGKKMFRRGHVIDESFLKKPLVVRYGQPIKLQMVQGNLTLTMDARAKGAGAIGDDIPIFLPETRKNMNATIVDHGLVRVQ